MSVSAIPAVDGVTTSQRRNAEVVLAVGVVAVIALLVVPLPGILLDLLLALSIGGSIVILLIALQVADALEFSSFPAVLLLMTLYRLALNVSATRAILGQGHAGTVIQAFGKFVVGGNYVVGLVMFLILVAINFLVITKGAGRVAEVAARFTLDAMPGKQMAIDADLQAGLIDEREAVRRREEIGRQADFFGAMDGSSKFVKGDAIAAVLITIINIFGGIFVGVIQRNMTLMQAASTYTLLTVGEGLVSQIPALIISVSAGLIVTRTTGKQQMGMALAGQLGSKPTPMYVAAGLLGAFAFLPGLPFLPFLMLAGTMGGLGYQASKRKDAAAKAAEARQQTAAKTVPPAKIDPMTDLIQVDPIELEVGYAVITIADEKEGGDLLERIQMLRKQAALELGLLIPPVRIRDDARLAANDYVIKIRGAEVARGEVLPRFLLALNTGTVERQVDGIDTVDPSFGLPARWIATSRRNEAEAYGYTVVEPSTMLATHLIETCKANGAELLGRQDVFEMLETLKRSHPALVEEMVPVKLSLAVLHRVLQRLLRERVPIRDLVTIIEALGDSVDSTKDVEVLTEGVRRALSNAIGRQYADQEGRIHGILLGQRLEAALLNMFGNRSTSGLTQEVLAGLLRQLSELTTQHAQDGRPAPLIVTAQLRVGVRRLVETPMASVPVLSYSELPPQLMIAAVGQWELPESAAL